MKSQVRPPLFIPIIKHLVVTYYKQINQSQLKTWINSILEAIPVSTFCNFMTKYKFSSVFWKVALAQKCIILLIWHGLILQQEIIDVTFHRKCYERCLKEDFYKVLCSSWLCYQVILICAWSDITSLTSRLSVIFYSKEWFSLRFVCVYHLKEIIQELQW